MNENHLIYVYPPFSLRSIWYWFVSLYFDDYFDQRGWVKE